MFKFLIGVVVGVFLGVIVIAPNPDLSAKVQDLWVDAKVWASAFWSAAENVAEDAGETARGVANEAAEGAGELARDAEDATQ